MNLSQSRVSPEFLLNQIQTVIDPKASEVKVFQLAGDASNRAYYRLDVGLKGHQRRTIVLMALADPEPFKQSEEKESGHLVSTEIPFLNIQRYFFSAGVAVPQIYHDDQKNRLIYLEDLGDVTFEAVVKNAPADRLKQFYRQAIDGLIKIQNCKNNSHFCVAFERSYNQPLLVWEFEHFLEYGVEKKGGRKPNLEDTVVFKESFHRISTMIAAESPLLVHRDYHSRNLMVQGETLRVIDFQDALMGPPQYDLASLLRDAYMTLPEALIDEMVEYYLDQKEKEEKGSINRRQFRYLFDLISLQRNMKAAGRFVFIDVVKKNPNFLKYVPKALKDISINLNKYPELKSLKASLVRYLPELA
jgi:hypothetical protein